MHSVLLLGAGKIGRTIAKILTPTGDYRVRLADNDDRALERLSGSSIDTVQLDASDKDALVAELKGFDTVISALSYRFNPLVAEAALEAGTNYFDLTEDVATTRRVRQVAASAKPGQVFVPQCGLAPGFISIVAYDLTRRFDSLRSVRMRVGALPQFPTNALMYNLTWSTDGLINEYCNPCEAIFDGQPIDVLPLEGLERFSLNGINYEAFNTSGGLGTLCETLKGQVQELNYKTIRYPGHQKLMNVLVNDLHLRDRRDVLKDILEMAVPVTYQDVVVIFCTVTGMRRNELCQISDARRVYEIKVGTETWSAIQITTASGICAALDLHLEGKLPKSGFIRQEDIAFDDFITNRFGKNYEGKGPPPPTEGQKFAPRLRTS